MATGWLSRWRWWRSREATGVVGRHGVVLPGGGRRSSTGRAVMTQTSPERVQAGPEIGEQDRPETAEGQDVPRVYVVAGEQDGDLLGGPAVECRPGGVVSIPAALLGAGEVVS